MQMLTATNCDGPAFTTRSKTSHQCQTTTNTEPYNTQPNKESITTVETTQDATPKSLMDDRHKALLQMQKMDPFCKCISKQLSNCKANLFTQIKGLLYKHVIDANQKLIYGTHHTKSLEVHSTSRSI